MSRNALILCLLLYGWDLANMELAPLDPAHVFCREMGYTVEGAYCVFPDGDRCKARDFLDGACGAKHVHPVSCADAGERRGVAVECCEGLVELANAVPVEYACVHLFGFSLCSACDDGVCDDWENSCNCPQDCAACIGEGGTILGIPDPPPCCEGLELIPPRSPAWSGLQGYCTARCGDGACDPGIESAYNCPQDCRRGRSFDSHPVRYAQRARSGPDHNLTVLSGT